MLRGSGMRVFFCCFFLTSLFCVTVVAMETTKTAETLSKKQSADTNKVRSLRQMIGATKFLIAQPKVFKNEEESYAYGLKCHKQISVLKNLITEFDSYVETFCNDSHVISSGDESPLNSREKRELGIVLSRLEQQGDLCLSGFATYASYNKRIILLKHAKSGYSDIANQCESLKKCADLEPYHVRALIDVFDDLGVQTVLTRQDMLEIYTHCLDEVCLKLFFLWSIIDSERESAEVTRDMTLFKNYLIKARNVLKDSSLSWDKICEDASKNIEIADGLGWFLEKHLSYGTEMGSPAYHSRCVVYRHMKKKMWNVLMALCKEYCKGEVWQDLEKKVFSEQARARKAIGSLLKPFVEEQFLEIQEKTKNVSSGSYFCALNFLRHINNVERYFKLAAPVLWDSQKPYWGWSPCEMCENNLIKNKVCDAVSQKLVFGIDGQLDIRKIFVVLGHSDGITKNENNFFCALTSHGWRRASFGRTCCHAWQYFSSFKLNSGIHSSIDALFARLWIDIFHNVIEKEYGPLKKDSERLLAEQHWIRTPVMAHFLGRICDLLAKHVVVQETESIEYQREFLRVAWLEFLWVRSASIGTEKLLCGKALRLYANQLNKTLLEFNNVCDPSLKDGAIELQTLINSFLIEKGILKKETNG